MEEIRVTRYKTDDQQVFDTEEEALDHELRGTTELLLERLDYTGEDIDAILDFIITQKKTLYNMLLKNLFPNALEC